MTQFWLNDLSILFNKNHITEIWPNSEYDLGRKLNAVTRIIILLTILGYFATKSIKIIISAVVGIVALIILYYTKSTADKKEAFQNISKEKPGDITKVMEKRFTLPSNKNPLMNVMMDEYKYKPKRPPAAPAYNEKIVEKMNNDIKKRNPKLYKNLGDNLEFEHSMRNFYSMPNTTIPNKQKDFAEFCYGNMPSCKEGDGLQCTKNNAFLRTN
jgi:hypothetical protein